MDQLPQNPPQEDMLQIMEELHLDDFDFNAVITRDP